MERIVSTQTTKYLELNKLITDSQYGYRPDHSTISTICDFTDDLHAAIEKNQINMAVFIDFRKAFDCVDHSILTKKLQNMGFNC